jgi:hypothetical protein
VAHAVHPAQHPPFKRSAQQTHDHRGQQQRQKETGVLGDGVTHISTQHVKARVGKIEHAHHAENQR